MWLNLVIDCIVKKIKWLIKLCDFKMTYCTKTSSWGQNKLLCCYYLIANWNMFGFRWTEATNCATHKLDCVRDTNDNHDCIKDFSMFSGISLSELTRKQCNNFYLSGTLLIISEFHSLWVNKILKCTCDACAIWEDLNQNFFH